IIITIGVAGIACPRLGNELHRAYRAIEFGVIVELTAIGVHNLRGAIGAVQRDTDDGWLGITVVIQFRWLEEISAICAVACFNPADASESIPAQIALRPRLLGDEL